MANGETEPELNSGITGQGRNPAKTPEPSGESPSWAAPQIGRRTPLPSNRACAISGILAAALDGFMLIKSGSSISGSLIGALFIGVFVYGGMRLVTGARRKIRPDYARPPETPTNETPTNDTPQQPNPAGAPKGGWANPTAAQKLSRRITRITSNYGKRRPPRR